MIIGRLRAMGLWSLAIAAIMLAAASCSQAAIGPVKEVISSHIGKETDKTTGGNICTVASKDMCQPAKFGSEPGTFEFAKAVAGATNGNVYVAEAGNHRVQELDSTGTFVSMFGWDVNKTNEKAALQSERNVCTASSKDICQPGVEGTAPEQFAAPSSVAVDPISGDVYVADGERVQKFTAAGDFVFEIGEEVNGATKGNLCTEEEAKKGVECVGSASRTGEAMLSEPFLGPGLTLAVGGSEDLLYVGDQHRIQEFEQTGKYKGEISLTSISSVPESRVSSIAVDKLGNVYFVYEVNFSTNVIHEIDSAGLSVGEFPVTPRRVGRKIAVTSLALDPAGRLAVVEFEDEAASRGSLYEVGTNQLHLITEFENQGEEIAFNGSDQLYAITVQEGELIAYSPVPVGELINGSAQCTPGAEQETDVTLSCDLNGKVDPWGVAETAVWFQWGRTPALGERTTPSISIPNEAGKSGGEEENPVPVSASIGGLRPNEHFYYEVAGEDRNVRSPEQVTSESASFTTPLVPPKVIGVPKVSFVRSSSAVMSGELNPENASTEYFFEYGPAEAMVKCPGVRVEACPGVLTTATAESSVYGRIATTLEARNLQPATAYSYRLSATDEGGGTVGRGEAEGSFETSPAPAPQASTGAANSITTTSAIVTGAVDPAGQAATYKFELGIAAGVDTQFGVIFSGPVEAVKEAVEEATALVGLQPGTNYAYRIAVSSGYVKNGTQTEYGLPVIFRTLGSPSSLVSPATPAQLSIPHIEFPRIAAKPLTNAQKLTGALKVCKKRKPRKRRAACERKAQKRYGKKK